MNGAIQELLEQLPTIDPQGEGEPTAYYGLRLLTFILQTGITATLSDDDLKLADHAALTGVRGKDILPLAVDKISAVRHTIVLVLKFRAHLDQLEAEPIVSTAGPRPSTEPTSTVPREPLPIVNPPSGAKVSIAF